jgi:polyhydroxybutyrate depolymerase
MRKSRILLLASLAALTVLLAIRHAHGYSTDMRGEITVDGRQRTYLLHVPAREHSEKPLPLVLALHGRLGNGEGQERLSHFDAVSDAHGFIVVYPDGLDRSWADGRGATPSDKNGVNDTKFISELIEKLSREYRIDEKRIYATGMSNGGFMSGRLACELSLKIAAVAIVAASFSDNIAGTCHPEKPISVLVMQGTADPLVPFDGGPLGNKRDRGNLFSHADAVKKWADVEACVAAPVKHHIPNEVGDGTSIDVTTYSACDGRTEVIDYVIINGGHAWPGGMQYLGERLIGKTSKNLDASEVIWRFFSVHSR